MRREAEKQLEVDQLKGLRERIEQLEANTVIHMPTSAGDAAAGAGTSPQRAISPSCRPTSEGLDASTMRSMCRDEARRAIEELRGELLGGDLLCDELLNGGAGLRPALELLVAEMPVSGRESALNSEVAELRASVDGAAAAATAAATAEIGRLDGAFRSSLAAEVRDLGSLCEGVRIRIEALDHSAAEHIGRLSARIAELEVRAEDCTPSSRSACQRSGPAERPWSGEATTPRVALQTPRRGGPVERPANAEATTEGEPPVHGDACDAGASNLKPQPPPQLSPRSSGRGVSRQESSVSFHSVWSSGSGGMGGDPLEPSPVEVRWALPPPARLQPQVERPSDVVIQTCDSNQLPPSRPGKGLWDSRGEISTPRGEISLPSGPGKVDVLRAPSTPPKRHVPPGISANLATSPSGSALGRDSSLGGGGLVPPAAGTAPVSSRGSKGGQKELLGVVKPWALCSPGRLEVRGGC